MLFCVLRIRCRLASRLAFLEYTELSASLWLRQYSIRVQLSSTSIYENLPLFLCSPRSLDPFRFQSIDFILCFPNLLRHILQQTLSIL